MSFTAMKLCTFGCGGTMRQRVYRGVLMWVCQNTVRHMEKVSD